MKKFISFALCASFMLCMTGCESKEKEPVPVYDPAPPFAPLTEIKEGRKDVYLIIKDIESSYWQVVVDGAKDGGDDLDCNVYYSGCYNESDWESQSRLLDEAVSAGADAVLLAPNDSVKLSAKIEEVYSKGVRIVLVDTTANTESYDVCYMTDNLMAGQQASAEMIEQLHNKGYTDDEELGIGVQVITTTSQTINERLAGFLQYWAKNAPVKWSVIPDIKYNDGDIDRGYEVARELIRDYPEMKGLFATNNSSAFTLATAIKEKERTDIVLVGFDYSDEIAELINSDEYTASTVIQRQYDMAYDGIRTALELTDGKKTEQKFIDTGTIVVDPDNIDAPEVLEALGHNRG